MHLVCNPAFTPKSLPFDSEEATVITRRHQLALSAEKKAAPSTTKAADDLPAAKRGRGRGNGRGRGRGRGGPSTSKGPASKPEDSWDDAWEDWWWSNQASWWGEGGWDETEQPNPPAKKIRASTAASKSKPGRKRDPNEEDAKPSKPAKKAKPEAGPEAEGTKPQGL